MERAIGSILGGAVGDSLGMVYEIFPCSADLRLVHDQVLTQRRKIAYDNIALKEGGPWADKGLVLNAGEWTDDTSMMLCLADSILTTQNIDIADLMTRFVNWWFKSYNSCNGYSLGLGSNVKRAIYTFDSKNPYEIRGGKNPSQDAGNGSLMRLAPVPVFWHNDLLKAMEMARVQTSTTHNVLETLDGSALMCFIIWHALQGRTKDQIFGMLDQCPVTFPEIAELCHVNAPWRSKTADDIRTLPGRCLWSLEAALWCVYYSHTFEDAMIKAVKLGGDADTVGSITGQIAGAIYGYGGIPQRWLEGLWHKDKIIARARALYGKEPYVPAEMDLRGYVAPEEEPISETI
jgi:ADP-ribosyl-[dinitrogen reductase] hydrolase